MPGLPAPSWGWDEGVGHLFSPQAFSASCFQFCIMRFFFPLHLPAFLHRDMDGENGASLPGGCLGFWFAAFLLWVWAKVKAAAIRGTIWRPGC